MSSTSIEIKPDSFNRVRVDYIRNLGADTGRLVLTMYGKSPDDRTEIAVKLPLYKRDVPELVIDQLERAISAAKVDIINYRTEGEAALIRAFDGDVSLDKGGEQ